MYSFIICLLILIVSYFVYGSVTEKILGIDGSKETPAYRMEDGVDYVPLNKRKLFLLHFLNIAGLGPIFGAIQGALFGPAAFLWITFGTIFAGCVHDFLSGFFSVRKDGSTMPGIIKKYLGNYMRLFSAVLTIITGVLISAVFASGAANLLTGITHIPIVIWIILIFIYFVIATLLPIDKVMGNIYPIFGGLFLVMTILMILALFLSPLQIPEFTTQGLYFSKNPIFPFLFVTIACGALSGFHSSQSPIVARCVENEREMRPIFFGAMLLEGIIALFWAAIAMAFFNFNPQLAVLYGATPSIAVNEMAVFLLGPLGLILTIIGVVVCPITTGDTALRSSRITLADELSIDQTKLTSRLKLSLPLFIVAFVLTFVNFTIVWRYFAWLQLIAASILLWAGSVYLIKHDKFHWITTLPAILTVLILIAYILQAPEGLQINALISNVIAVICTIIITIYFFYKYKYKKDAFN